MEHSNLYELKIKQLTDENKTLQQKLDKQELIKEGYRTEVAKWNKKYKDLKNQMIKSN